MTKYVFPEQIDRRDSTQPLLDGSEIKGGYKIVADASARNLIPIAKREIGSLVTIGTTLKQYKGASVNDIDWINDANWEAVSNYADFVSKTDVLEQSMVGALALPTLSIDNIKFNPNFNDPTPMEIGECRFSPLEQTFDLKTKFQTLQLNKELFETLRNHNAYPLLNGRVIRLVGFNGEYFTIDYADNTTEEKANWFGILTCDIPAYTGINDADVIGSATLYGFVRGLDTSTCNSIDRMYLASADGLWTCTKPSGAAYIRELGFIGVVSATEGTIYVRSIGNGIGDIEEKQLAMNMPHGIPIEEKEKISFAYNINTRQLTVSGTFYYFHKTKKYVKTAYSTTVQHFDTNGPKSVYFEGSNLYITDTTFVWGEAVPIYVLEYNKEVASTFWLGKQARIICERHGSRLEKTAHKIDHDKIGCYTLDGFVLSGYTQATGSGGLTANTFAIQGGTIQDEDNSTVIPNLADNNGVGNVYRIRYRLGTVWYWFDTNLPYLFTASNILYNPITGGSGALTQLTSNGTCMSMWLAVAPTLDLVTGLPTTFAYEIIIGQYTDTSVTSARTRTWSELDLSGLPSKEYAPVKQIIFQRQTSYDDNGNCRIEDVRNIVGGFASSQTQSAPSVHNNTTDRDAADAHPISSITNLQTVLGAKLETIPNDSVTYAKTGTDLKASIELTGTEIDFTNHKGLYKVMTADTAFTYANLIANKGVNLSMSGNFAVNFGTAICLGGTYSGTLENTIQFVVMTNSTGTLEVRYTISQPI